MKGCVVDSACTRHIGAFKEEFSSYTPMAEGIECIYVGDTRSVPVSGKGKVLLKLTSLKFFHAIISFMYLTFDTISFRYIFLVRPILKFYLMVA